MPPIVLSEPEYRDKVYACWLGKNIGGTLGAPVEGRKETRKFFRMGAWWVVQG